MSPLTMRKIVNIFRIFSRKNFSSLDSPPLLQLHPSLFSYTFRLRKVSFSSSTPTTLQEFHEYFVNWHLLCGSEWFCHINVGRKRKLFKYESQGFCIISLPSISWQNAFSPFSRPVTTSHRRASKFRAKPVYLVKKYVKALPEIYIARTWKEIRIGKNKTDSKNRSATTVFDEHSLHYLPDLAMCGMWEIQMNFLTNPVIHLCGKELSTK